MARRDNWRLQREAWADSRLSSRDRLVALCLIWHRNGRTGQCNPSWDCIMRECGLSRSSVIRALSSLQSLGWIVVSPSGQKSAAYYINGSGVTQTPPRRSRKRRPSPDIPGWTSEGFDAWRDVVRDQAVARLIQSQETRP